MKRTLVILSVPQSATDSLDAYAKAVDAAYELRGFRFSHRVAVSNETLARSSSESHLPEFGQSMIWAIEAGPGGIKLDEIRAELSLPQEYHIYVPEPTADVARTITELFPAIEESLATCPSSAQTSEAFVDDRTPTKPFPLSNLALAAESASAGRELSPKIARALEQLERRDSASTVSDVKRQREVFESTLEEEEGEASASEEIIDRTPRRPSSVALSASTTSATSISSFKARPAPPLPTAEPRLTKSAALRLGVALPASTPRASTKRQSISTSERAALDRLTRRQSVQLPPAPPAKPVEVRMSKAAMLRIGMPVPDKESNRRSRQSTATSLDEALPPANRRLSVSSSLKSLREPTIAPRSTKSSALRTGKLDDSRSTNTARTRGVNILRDDQANATPKSTDQRRESVPRHPVAGARAGRASIATAARTGVSDVDFAGVPGHKRRESIAVPTMHQPPAHTPRPNRASLLRQKGESTSAAPAVPPHARRESMAASSSSASSSSGPLPRLNRAAELRLNALGVAKEQVPPVSKARRGSTVVSATGPGQKKTAPRRPASAMSDLSNGSRT